MTQTRQQKRKRTKINKRKTVAAISVDTRDGGLVVRTPVATIPSVLNLYVRPVNTGPSEKVQRKRTSSEKVNE